MNRRDFLQRAAMLVSAAVASRHGWAVTAEQQRHLMTSPDYVTREVNYFSPAQRLTLAMLAETIIPATETPGAIDAGTPMFIELMVADWFTEGERSTFHQGLVELMASVAEEYGTPFESLAPDTRLRILEDLESAASDSAWYESGNMKRDLGKAPFICQLKELTVWGFFTSEVGASQVLRHNPMPMRFDGDVPLGAEESSWSSPMVK